MDLTVMHINKGNAHGTQGNAVTGLNSQLPQVLRSFDPSRLDLQATKHKKRTDRNKKKKKSLVKTDL